MNKNVRQEEILLFLEQRENFKFDRETFSELIERIEQ